MGVRCSASPNMGSRPDGTAGSITLQFFHAVGDGVILGWMTPSFGRGYKSWRLEFPAPESNLFIVDNVEH